MGLIYFQHCARNWGYESVRNSSRSQGAHSPGGDTGIWRGNCNTAGLSATFKDCASKK